MGQLIGAGLATGVGVPVIVARWRLKPLGRAPHEHRAPGVSRWSGFSRDPGVRAPPGLRGQSGGCVPAPLPDAS